jgi:DNA-binding response OmpR family regulator
MRIIIFEDNDMLRSVLKDILEQVGYEVIAYSNPGLCPTYGSIIHDCPLDEACSDVIISDVNMPTQNGLELMKERKRKGCKAKYQALMSGDWTDSDLKDAKELDCRLFHKPFNLKEMLRWLNHCNEQIDPERKLSKLPLKQIDLKSKNR